MPTVTRAPAGATAGSATSPPRRVPPGGALAVGSLLLTGRAGSRPPDRRPAGQVQPRRDPHRHRQVWTTPLTFGVPGASTRCWTKSGTVLAMDNSRTLNRSVIGSSRAPQTHRNGSGRSLTGSPDTNVETGGADKTVRVWSWLQGASGRNDLVQRWTDEAEWTCSRLHVVPWSWPGSSMRMGTVSTRWPVWLGICGRPSNGSTHLEKEQWTTIRGGTSNDRARLRTAGPTLLTSGSRNLRFALCRPCARPRRARGQESGRIAHRREVREVGNPCRIRVSGDPSAPGEGLEPSTFGLTDRHHQLALHA